MLGLGLLLGLRHAADPDHVVAVTAIVGRTRRAAAAAWVGVVWGLGHSLTLLTVGLGIVLLGWVVPPRLGLALEFTVALALVGLGLWNLRPAPERSEPAALPARRAFWVGLVHGLAGSAAVALLVLATVRDAFWAAVYLGLFALGTLLGMAGVTTGFALPLAAYLRRTSLAPARVRVVTGVLSLAFGIWLAWQTGWQDGLFSAVPRWSPH